MLTNRANIYYSIREFIITNRIKIIICLICCIIGILTGIFTAVKLSKQDEKEIFEAFNLTKSIYELEKYSQNFFSRLLSCELVMLILLAFSQHYMLFPLGICVVTYRTFLVAINCSMIIVLYSLGGILKSVLIIFPCQIITILIMFVYFCVSSNHVKHNKSCKKYKAQSGFPSFLLFSIVIMLINVVETLLLFIFKSSVILVI